MASDWFVGTGEGQFAAITLVGCVIVLVGMLLYRGAAWADDADNDVRAALWRSWTMFTDPGTQTGEGSDWRQQCVAVFISISGYIFFLSVMGIVVDLVRKKLDDWKTFHSRVVANGHTLILGWTEATPRLVVQMAFLRRAWKLQNETCARRWFPWLRVPPSTPVAAAPIVRAAMGRWRRLWSPRAGSAARLPRAMPSPPSAHEVFRPSSRAATRF